MQNRSGVHSKNLEKYTLNTGLGAEVIRVEKGPATVSLDATREVWRLPTEGAFEVQSRTLKRLEGGMPTLMLRISEVKQKPGTAPITMAGTIRGGEPSVYPYGVVARNPIALSWVRTVGANRTEVNLLDASGKSLWRQELSGVSLATLMLPAEKLKTGTWYQGRVVQSGSGSPVVGVHGFA